MIRAGWVGAGAAGFLSTVLHMGGVHLLWAEEDALIAGGAPTSVVRLGNSFQDVAQGVAEPEPITKELEPESAETALEGERPVETEQDRAAETIAASSDTSQAAADRPHGMLETVTPRDLRTADPPETIAADHASPITALIAQDSLMASAPVKIEPDVNAISPIVASEVVRLEPTQAPEVVQSLEPLEPSISVDPVETPNQLAALPNPDDDQAAPQVSARPGGRPKAIEDKAIEIAKARAKEAVRAEQTQTAARAKQSQPKGTSKPNQVRGQNSGQANARSAEQSIREAKNTSVAGNAAASNFRGLVQRQIARQRQPKDICGEGRAVVNFSIASNGSLGSIGIAQSSGRPDLDRASLLIVQRAAPFPKPPPGARRSFTQPISLGC